MLTRDMVLVRFAVERVIVVADRGLHRLENMVERAAVAHATQRKLQFILAVPARHYGELGVTLDALAFERERASLAEGEFAGHRLIVALDPRRAAEQSAMRRERIGEVEAFAERLVTKLDAQDEGQTSRGRKASDRGDYSRFQQAVVDAELTRFNKADQHVDRFSYAIGERARAAAGRFDGKLVLLTNSNDFKLEQTVERYTSLADFGYGFRGLESDLDIAPVCHRLPDRIRAHGLICFLALVLHRVMRLRLKACGSTACPKTALEIPRRLPKHRVHIGSKHLGGTGRIRPKQLEMFVALRLTKPA